MANSEFPVKIQPRGASNPLVIDAMKACTIAYPPGTLFWYRQEVRFAQSEFTPAAATSQEIDLNVTYADGRRFISNVQRLAGSFMRVLVPIRGTLITAATGELGDNGDPSGIFTASDIYTAAGLLPSTPAAAENTARPETAYAPTFTVRLTGANVTAVTQGHVVCFIPFRVLVP
jgi:hypothetical protein